MSFTFPKVLSVDQLESLEQLCRVGTINILIRKLRIREVKRISRSHTAGVWWRGNPRQSLPFNHYTTLHAQVRQSLTSTVGLEI